MDKEDFQKHDINISIGAKIILEKYIVDSKKINEDPDIPNILTFNNYVKRTFNVYFDPTLRKKNYQIYRISAKSVFIIDLNQYAIQLL